MPELPDVETYCRYLDSTVGRHRIRKVRVVDDQVLDGVTQRKLNARLKRKQFNETRRHGKYLLARVGRDQWLAVHFGMTGDVDYFKDDDDVPEYAQVVFDLSNGYHLAYIATRKLGRISLVSDPDDFINEKDLGPDVRYDLNRESFVETLHGHRGGIKSALMNQSLMAGLGNVYSDEILYRAHLHPSTQVSALSRKDLGKLWRRVEAVTDKAIEKQADPERMPRSWLVRRREEGAECGICSGKIVKREFGGRGAYLCDRHQKRSMK